MSDYTLGIVVGLLMSMAWTLAYAVAEGANLTYLLVGLPIVLGFYYAGLYFSRNNHDS